jgi:hypothetical protein
MIAHELRVESDGHTVTFDGICPLNCSVEFPVLFLSTRGRDRTFSRIREIQMTETGCIVTVEQPYRAGIANVLWAIGGRLLK